MISEPLISVVIIFYNAEKYLEEAVESVISQTYSNWELILVDDGSSDRSTKIAEEYHAKFPGKVFYYEHKDHSNKGMSASRNLGVQKSKGEIIAFLDADDKWLDHKLTGQLKIIRNNPEAVMIAGQLLVWYSWNHSSGQKDFRYRDHTDINRLFYPHEALPMIISGKLSVPSTSSIFVKKKYYDEVGGYEDEFTTLYEDQVFYVKIFSNYPVYYSEELFGYYRMHDESSVSTLYKQNKELTSRERYLMWVKNYIHNNNISDKNLLVVLSKEFWLLKIYKENLKTDRQRNYFRWFMKWVFRFEDKFIPRRFSNNFWINKLKIVHEKN